MLPPELLALCHQLSNTPAKHLPYITPGLLQSVYRLQGPLSQETINAGKADASEISALVHKFKTQLTTLLYGKTAEGKFTAAALIKAVVDVGGWEVLRSSEQWVRGLVAILGKQDGSSTKQLCILTLTSIYLNTHRYPTLVREITSPTLPTFVSSCLNLVSASPRHGSVPSYGLIQSVFDSFGTLLPRHPTIFRSSATQIRLTIAPYLAPTRSDATFVPDSLSQPARRLFILQHLTAPKNTSGEEWGKAIRELIKTIHVTADQVFRAVLEDWESTAGYQSQEPNIDRSLQGGGKAEGDLPAWNGIEAGLERLEGLLALLRVFFGYGTTMAVVLPLGMIVDLSERMCSMMAPTSKGSSEIAGTRARPGIDRDERNALWAAIPRIHVATLRMWLALADRLGDAFQPLAHNALAQTTWTFRSSRYNEELRTTTYQLVAKILSAHAPYESAAQVNTLIPIVRDCCRDLESTSPFASLTSQSPSADQSQPTQNPTTKKPAQISNTDSFLGQISASPFSKSDSALSAAATTLLPLLISNLPQSHLHISIRGLIDRAAILTANKDAMLASVLEPFVNKNGLGVPTILPHLTRAFPRESAVEALLRPRFPMLPSKAGKLGRLPDQDVDADMDEDEDDDEVISGDATNLSTQAVSGNVFGGSGFAQETVMTDVSETVVQTQQVASNSGHQQALEHFKASKSFSAIPESDAKGKEKAIETLGWVFGGDVAMKQTEPTRSQAGPPTSQADVAAQEGEEDSSDDESVHLQMEFDESEDEEMAE